MLGARIGAFFSVIAISCLVGSPIGGAMIWEQTRTGYRPVILYAVSFFHELQDLEWSANCSRAVH